MRDTKEIIGLRQPTQKETLEIGRQWQNYTNVTGLRFCQFAALLTMVLLSILAVQELTEGATFVFIALISGILLLCAAILWWGHLARNIIRYGKKLSNGKFALVEASGINPRTSILQHNYAAKADAKLPDGTVIEKLDIPFRVITALNWHYRKTFLTYLVQIEGEKKPMLFYREES